MTSTTKRRIAREWLYLLACILFGLTVMPFLLFLILIVFFFPDQHGTLAEFFRGFCSALAGKEKEAFVAWLIAAGPYVLFQLVRSVIWAWKTIRNPGNVIQTHEKQPASGKGFMKAKYIPDILAIIASLAGVCLIVRYGSIGSIGYILMALLLVVSVMRLEKKVKGDRKEKNDGNESDQPSRR
jgi:hypothetical protein